MNNHEGCSNLIITLMPKRSKVKNMRHITSMKEQYGFGCIDVLSSETNTEVAYKMISDVLNNPTNTFSEKLNFAKPSYANECSFTLTQSEKDNKNIKRKYYLNFTKQKASVELYRDDGVSISIFDRKRKRSIKYDVINLDNNKSIVLNDFAVFVDLKIHNEQKSKLTKAINHMSKVCANK